LAIDFWLMTSEQPRGLEPTAARGMHCVLFMDGSVSKPAHPETAQPHHPRVSRVDSLHRELIARALATGGSTNHTGPFRRFARAASSAVGRPWAFSAAAGVVLSWAMLGPLFHYSDTWQLVINTGTTIITFLMVFLIQNTQNRDTETLRLKLDELILATQAARNEFVDLDDLNDEQLAQLHKNVCKAAQQRTGASGER
jgi:low affinity Fe/Cu permease